MSPFQEMIALRELIKRRPLAEQLSWWRQWAKLRKLPVVAPGTIIHGEKHERSA